MLRTGMILYLSLSVVLLSSLFSVHPVAARSLNAEDGVIGGTLTFDKRYVAVQPIVPGQPLRVVLHFDPQDQQELRRRSGFFVLDGDRFRSVLAGGSLLDNNLAAGSSEGGSPVNELVATIVQPSGEYTIVIYNDTDIPMTYRLSVENGHFPQEENQTDAVAAASISQSAEAKILSGDRSASADPVHIVRAGESMSLIAQSVYGDLTLYDRLCSYNSVPNCDVIEVGQSIRTPALSLLTGVAAPTIASTAAREATASSAPALAAVPVAASSGDSYTVAAGDTLGTIAQKLYADFQRFRDICSVNALPDCNTISIGQVLRLPDGSAVAQSPASLATLSASTTVAPATTTPVAPIAIVPTPTLAVPSADAPPLGAATVSGADIADTLGKSSDKSVFLLLWDTTGLTSILKGSGPLTLFVPSDASFAPELQTNLDTWMNSKQILERLLSNHLVGQAFDPASVAGGPVDLPTLAGATIRVERTASGGLLVNGAQVIGSPITASNGTIYTIDQVLLPPQ